MSTPSNDRYSDESTSGRGAYEAVDNFNFMSLEEEALARGWVRQSMPVGPGDGPQPAPTVGMRGEPDIDDDPSFGPGATSSITGG